MTYQEALQYLGLFINFESTLDKIDGKDFSLDGLRKFLLLIGNPQDQLKFVHIAGSKGKGSTASLTAEILKQNGYRVGLYTSPHLYDIRERIRTFSLKEHCVEKGLFGDEISEDAFARLMGDLKSIIEKEFVEDSSPFGLQSESSGKEAKISARGLTYFELLTALAFLYFKESKVDIVILETGLGGRLDATNVVKPLVSAITLIDLEHTRILGDTIQQIAEEKAEIIKLGSFHVVSAQQPVEAMDVIQKKCNECQVELSAVGKDIFVRDVFVEQDGLSFDVYLSDNIYHCGMNTLGEFQAENAAMAIGIVESLRDVGFSVDHHAVEKGIANAFLPGRMEIVLQDPIVIVDGAHTASSSRSVCESVRTVFPHQNIVLIFGMSSDKDQHVVANNFSDIASKVVFTKSSHERAEDIVLDVVKVFEGRNIECVSLPIEDVVKEVFNNKSLDIFLVAGSIFLAAEMRRLLLQREA